MFFVNKQFAFVTPANIVTAYIIDADNDNNKSDNNVFISYSWYIYGMERVQVENNINGEYAKRTIPMHLTRTAHIWRG